MRAKLTCTYKEESDIFIRDQTYTIRKKFEGPPSGKKGQGSGSTQRRSASRSPSSTAGSTLLRALAQDPESVAIAVWLTKYCSQKRDPEGSQGLIDLLPAHFGKAAVGSALSLAVSAEALAIVGRWPERIDWKNLSFVKYTESCALVNKALASPEDRMRDDILVAVFVLFFYERVNRSMTPAGALAHVNGAVSLIKARGPASFAMSESQVLLWLARSHVINTYFSPFEGFIPGDELWTDPPSGIYQNTSTRLVSIISRMSSIWRLMRRIAGVDATDESLISEIVTSAQQVDRSLVQWAQTEVPAHWQPRQATSVSEYIREAGMYDELCTVYRNIWAVNEWSRYRIARVALQTIILQHVDRLSASTSELDTVVCDAQSILQIECDGICASVPFYLGSRDTSETIDQPFIEFPQCRELRMAEETREQLVMFGEWYLYWPLSRMLQNLQAQSRLGYNSLADDQVRWIEQQVLRCGERAQTRSPLGTEG